MDEKDVPLAVYEGDSPASVATDFAVAHKLDQDGAMAVFYHLKQVGSLARPTPPPADPVADGPACRCGCAESGAGGPDEARPLLPAVHRRDRGRKEGARSPPAAKRPIGLTPAPAAAR